jgi:hypothetical protein
MLLFLGKTLNAVSAWGMGDGMMIVDNCGLPQSSDDPEVSFRFYSY